MKNTFLLTFALILLAGSPLKAQEKEEAATLNKVVNTLKERITLAGYAQLGYTYDDAAKKMNTFDIKRIIFLTERSRTAGPVILCTTFTTAACCSKFTPITGFYPG